MEDEKFRQFPLKISGDADGDGPRGGADGHEKPSALYRLMDTSQKEQLFSNLAEAMRGGPERIMARQLVPFYKADPEDGRDVAKKLGYGPASRS